MRAKSFGLADIRAVVMRASNCRWPRPRVGESGGTVTVDHRGNEGRDAKALLTWLAKQPEARRDGRRDPRVGMHGVSYAGGIELVAAAIDRRIDAIAPAIA